MQFILPDCERDIMSDTDRNKIRIMQREKGSEKMDGSEKNPGKIIFEVLRYIRKYYAI